MSDDPDMPAFDKPEIIPLVVPDLTPAVPEKRRCIGKNKATGNPCKVSPLHGEKYCLGHAKGLAPELSAKWKMIGRGPAKGAVSRSQRSTRKQVGVMSKDDLLSLLSGRLDLIQERFGQTTTPEVEEMICNVIRTMAAVHKIELPEQDQKKKVMPPLEYEVKEPDARATA